MTIALLKIKLLQKMEQDKFIVLKLQDIVDKATRQEVRLIHCPDYTQKKMNTFFGLQINVT